MSAKLLRNTRSRVALQRRPFPIMLELGVAVEQVIQTEIDRSHVQAGHFRFEVCGGLDPFLHLHERAAAAGDVDHGIGLLLHPGQEPGECLRRLVGFARDRVAGVQMDDRRPGFGCANGIRGDLIRGDGQMRRHGWRVDRACHGAGDDDFPACCHGSDPCFPALSHTRAAPGAPESGQSGAVMAQAVQARHQCGLARVAPGAAARRHG